MRKREDLGIFSSEEAGVEESVPKIWRARVKSHYKKFQSGGNGLGQ